MDKKLRPHHGLILFVLFIAIMLTFGVFLQYKFGLLGSAVTEVLLLMLAVLFPRMLGIDLSSVFDMTPKPVSTFIGSLVFGSGAYLSIMAVNGITNYFFAGARETADSLSTLLTSQPAAIAVIIVAILPAICEEMLFRGCIQSSLRPLKHTWLIVLLVGIAFGIGHFDIYRFLPMAIMGATLSYVGIASGSMFLGMLLHFITNIISVVTAFGEKGEEVTEITSYSLFSVLGSVVVYLSFALLLFTVGYLMLNKKKLTPRTYLSVGTVTAIGYLVGTGLAAFGSDVSVPAAVGSILYSAAMTLTVFFIGWLILTRKRPSKAVIATVCASAVLCFSAGTMLGMLGSSPGAYSGEFTLSAHKTSQTHTFTVTEEGDYLFIASAKASASTIRISLMQFAEPEEDTSALESQPPESGSNETNHAQSEESELAQTEADTMPVTESETDTLPEDTEPEASESVAPQPKPTYYVTFEGVFINAESRLVHLLPGTYTVYVGITANEGALDRDVDAKAIVRLISYDL